MLDPPIRQKAEQAAYAAVERARDVDLDDWLRQLMQRKSFPCIKTVGTGDGFAYVGWRTNG